MTFNRYTLLPKSSNSIIIRIYIYISFLRPQQHTLIVLIVLSISTIQPEAREVAAAAIDLCHAFGGTIPRNHIVNRIAGVGSDGRNTQNAERDLQRVLQKIAVKAEIEWFDVRMWSPQEERLVLTKLPCIMPDKLASALWKMGRDVFRHFFLGGMSPKAVKKYWDHIHSTSTWFQQHPASTLPREGLIPMSFYGDGVQVYKNSEVGTIEVLAWSSDMCFKHGPLERYLFITAYSEHMESEHTFTDLLAVITQRFKRMVDLNEGHPWSPEFHFMFSSVQGDLKWLNDRHNIHPYNAEFFCSWCNCRKGMKRQGEEDIDVSLTLSDFRETAAHRRTVITNEKYLEKTSEDNSPLFFI